jgi:predicted permease
MRFWRRLRFYQRRAAFERELQDEIRSHLEMKEQEQLALGLAPEDAARAARLQFGNITLFREESGEMWTLHFLENVAQDLRYAARALRRGPGFTTAAVITLALGIGANTAIFTLIDALMLRPLPVRSPGELGALSWGNPGRTTEFFTYPQFGQLRDHAPLFSGVVAWDRARFNVGQREATERLEGLSVSGDYFAVLGVEAVVGRILTPDDDRPASAPVAVLSHRYWHRAFAGQSAVTGQTLVIDGIRCTIVGVLPAAFFGAEVGRWPDVFLPLSLQRELWPGIDRLGSRDSIWLRILARLRPGVSHGEAQSQLDALWPHMLAQVVPAQHPAESQSEFLNKKVFLAASSTGAPELSRSLQGPLLVLAASAFLVLLIACVNVATLLLARAAARGQEIAVRLAIGASRRRLVAQLLVESAVLALLGALAGLVLAHAGSEALAGLLPTRLEPQALNLRPNLRILGFTGAVALATIFLFGLAPSLAATHRGISQLRATDRGGAGFRVPGRILVVTQIALALPLLVGAGLFTRSLVKLASIDTGFQREGVLLTILDPRRSGLSASQLAGFYDRLLERVSQLPGVASAALSSRTPLGGDYWNSMVVVDGYAPPPGESAYVYFYRIGPGYFTTFQTPLVAGRDFGSGDHERARRVAIINESVARTYFPGLAPIGRRISAPQDPDRRNLEIIGVVKDARYDNLRESRSHTIYLPYRQHLGRLRGMTLSIRAAAPASATGLTAAVRNEVASLAPDLPVSFRTLAAQVEQQTVQERMIATLSTAFGLLALALACVGLYGLLAWSVARRRFEFGVRMALGAAPSTVRWLVLRETFLLALAGVILGLPAALAGGLLVSNLLFGVRPADPPALAAAAALVAAVAVVAGYLPARRASCVDPAAALRAE